MLLAVQIVGIKLINGKKKSAHNTTLKLNVTSKKKGDCLKCKPVFHLHPSPDPIKYKQLREALIKAVRQEPFDKKGFWQPAPSDRVCSIHFVDGLATYENPMPIPFLVIKVKWKNQGERYL